jgi:hypothetical protein
VLAYSLAHLLERTGAKLVGRNRANCPECRSRRTISYTDRVYYCHHAGCKFQGNVSTLAKRLGLLSRLSPARMAAERQAWHDARHAADYLLGKLKAEKVKLQTAHVSLLNAQNSATQRLKFHREDSATWAALAFIFAELPLLRAALSIMEDAPIPQRLAFLDGSGDERKEMAEGVILAGGLFDSQGRFIEVTP